MGLGLFSWLNELNLEWHNGRYLAWVIKSETPLSTPNGMSVGSGA